VSAPDHLTTAARHARTLATRGDLLGAQVVLDRAIEPAIAVLGPDHPEVISTTRLLASVNRDLGDLSGARRLLEEALAAGQFTLGDDSPALLPLSYDLATLADELGNRHEARRNYTRLLRHGPAVLGADHEYVRAARRYLGVDSAPEQTPPPADLTPPLTPPPTSGPPRGAATPPIYRPVDPAPAARASAPFAAPASGPPPPATPRPTPASAPVSAPHWDPRHDEHRHFRVPMVALILVAVMALIGGGIAYLLVFHGPRTGGGGPTTTAPSTASDQFVPPSDLKVRDEGATVTLTWADPSAGTAPIIVQGGPTDTAMKTLGTIEAGTTTFRINGLRSSADYCFLIAAVYSGQHVVPSSPACTARRAPSPTPSR
jgi:hypothetical protein